MNMFFKKRINPTGGVVLDPASVKGAIDFKDVVFRYPTREAKMIFNGFNLSIPPGMFDRRHFSSSAPLPKERALFFFYSGQSLAIVGESGSGKRCCCYFFLSLHLLILLSKFVYLFIFFSFSS